MDKEQIIEKIRDRQDIELNNIRLKIEKLDGYQEGYQKGTWEAISILQEMLKEVQVDE